MVKPKTLLWLALSPTASLSLGFLLVYLGYRFYYLCLGQITLVQSADDSESKTPASLALAWIFFSLELILLLPNILPYFIRIIAVRPPWRPRRYLAGDDVPYVDVLITCCNEEVDIITDTARAACVIDYPPDRFRIFVCDDGRSSAVQLAMEELNKEYHNVFYTTRKKPPIKDYKAGNLNNGLRYSSSIPLKRRKETDYDEDDGQDEKEKSFQDTVITIPPAAFDAGKCKHHTSVDTPTSSSSRTLSVSDVSRTSYQDDISSSEFVAGLDADMIPQPSWLRTILPHLMDDPKMALGCPPQTFYDIPEDDPLTQTMSQFAGTTELVNDALGHADCLGSGYVMRRRALEGIGGFPTESLSEDVCCSALLLGAGWKTAFVADTLQHGSVPDSFAAHIKQRTRWFVGHVQTARIFNLRLFGNRGKYLSLRQRLVGITFDLRQLVQVPLVLSFVLLPFALLSGSPLVFWSKPEELITLMRYVCCWSLSHWLHQGVVGLIAGVSHGQYDVRTPSLDSELEQWLGPYIAVAFFRFFVLPKAFGGTAMGFTPSGSIASQQQERDPANRAQLRRRLYSTLFTHLAIIHLLFILACIVGVGLVFARTFTHGVIGSAYYSYALDTPAEKLTYLITRIGWPPGFWLYLFVSALAPLSYALKPPSATPREELLDRDPKTGVAYPKEEAKKPPKSIWGRWRYIRATLAIIYTLTLLFCSTVLDRKLTEGSSITFLQAA